MYDPVYDPTLSAPGTNLWNDIYCPVLYLHAAEAEALLLDVESWTPRDRRGDVLAVVARAWMRLGRPSEAWRAFERAQALGGPEVASLARVVLPDALARCAADAKAADRPEGVAEAWLDAAAVALDRAEVPLARRAVADALEACPDHAEAAHFARMLEEPGVQRGWQRADLSGDRGRPPERVVLDARRLRPARRQGWVSEERLERRHVLAEEDRLVPSASALARLRAGGWYGFFLGTDGDFAGLAPGHTLTGLEIQAGHLVARVSEQRAAGPLAADTWARVLHGDDTLATDDLAQLLCALATRDPSLLPTGREAATWLLRRHGDHPPLWRAYAGWIEALAGDPGGEALPHAEVVLAQPLQDALAWRLAVATLARLGARSRAEQEIHARRHDPVCGYTARQLVSAGQDLADARVTCSPRLRPRRDSPAPRHPGSRDLPAPRG